MRVTFAPTPPLRQLTSIGLVKAGDELRTGENDLDAVRGTR